MVVKVEHSSHDHVVVMACLILPIISMICVIVRIWTRFFVSHSIGYDDYSSVVTLVQSAWYPGPLHSNQVSHSFYASHTASSRASVRSLSRRIARYAEQLAATTKDVANLPEYIKWTQIADMSYLASLFGYKLSILLLYLRIFGINNTFCYFTWLTIFFVFGYLCSNFFTQLFGCTPPNKYWHSNYAGHCIDYTIAGLAYGSMNFISDLIILILPVPIIWRLQLSRKQKIGVSLIFMTGAVTCAVSIIRYVAIVQANAANARYFVLSILEINVGLIITCVATFGPLLTHIKSKVDASFLHCPSAPWKTSIPTTTFQRRLNVFWCGSFGWGGYGRHKSSSSSRRHHATLADDGVSLAERGTAPPRTETGSRAAQLTIIQ